jgi:hypothetical protein
MRERQRVQGDLERIFQRFGYQSFRWHDVRDIVDNAPQYYTNVKIFEMTKTKDGHYEYRIPDGFFDTKAGKYRLKKKPIYPVKTYLVGVQ